MRKTMLIAALVAAAPAEATTTITLSGTIWDYQSTDFSNNYGHNLDSALEHWGLVGYGQAEFPNDPEEHEYNGRFAATIEFSLPDLPDNAVVTSASLSLLIGAYDGNSGDIFMRAYSASSAAFDPTRLFEGSAVTTFHPQRLPDNATIPLDTTAAVVSALDGTLPVPGFSFVQSADDCNQPRGIQQVYLCRTLLGTSEDFRIPTLTLSYDVATPPPPASSDVPEPATWMMLVTGFGLTGGALRRRKREVAFA